MWILQSIFRRRLAGAVSLAVAGALLSIGCGDEEETGNNGSVTYDVGNNGNNGTDDAGSGDGGSNSDIGPADMEIVDDLCEGIDCGQGLKCVKATCVDETYKVACEDVEELGELATGEVTQISGDTTGWADYLEATCASDDVDFSGPDTVFHFQVDAPAVALLTLTSDAPIDWLMEVRRSSCRGTDDVAVCSDPETANVMVKPDEDYYLVVEPLQAVERGAFDIDIEFTPLQCEPGTRECDGDQLSVCQVAGPDLRSCAGGCSGGACAGDACADAISVSASGSFSGDVDAYTSEFDFEDRPQCSDNQMTAIPTPGPDVILELTGLTAGQTVTIDASQNVGDDNDDAIFILDGCASDAGCQVGRDLGDTVTWSVPADGTYYAVIDRRAGSDTAFNFSVDIQ